MQMNATRKPRRNPRRPTGPQTLCWCCANAVPSPETGAGCSWSRREHTPVPGWVAERRDIPRYYTLRRSGGVTYTSAGMEESYRVISCPEFKEG